MLAGRLQIVQALCKMRFVQLCKGLEFHDYTSFDQQICEVLTHNDIVVEDSDWMLLQNS